MAFEKVEHLLPDTVLDIVDVIGLAATEQLVKAIGGARFKFGKGKVTPSVWQFWSKPSAK